MLVLALLAVFVAGLMVGRTPEFLGKKIRATQMKLVVTYVLTIPVTVLILGALSLLTGPGTSSILNPGTHGLSEVTYAFASAANNNGSAFAGLAANTTWYDSMLGLAMLIGRFMPIVLALAIAGSLAGARVHARTRATLDTTGPTFAAFLLAVIIIIGGLIYFPMLILGPIGEQITGLIHPASCAHRFRMGAFGCRLRTCPPRPARGTLDACHRICGKRTPAAAPGRPRMACSQPIPRPRRRPRSPSRTAGPVGQHSPSGFSPLPHPPSACGLRCRWRWPRAAWGGCSMPGSSPAGTPSSPGRARRTSGGWPS
jgi:Potassium-transporting ATPase A subunit